MINKEQVFNLNWNKVSGIIPAIIQDYDSGIVLMHGYMNKISLIKTIEERKVSFFSRTKKRLWTKGETSGNFLHVMSILIDCDKDTLLLIVKPTGNTCHKGNNNCFNYKKFFGVNFLIKLEKFLINQKNKNPKNSYTAALHNSGTKRIAQKVAEEGIEVSLSAVVKNKEELINESSDLIYHLLVLLNKQNISITNIVDNLHSRHLKVNN